MNLFVSRCERLNSSLPKDVHVLIPRTWDHVTLHGKRIFADVFKLKILRKGDYSASSGGTSVRGNQQCKRQRERGYKDKREVREDRRRL